MMDAPFYVRHAITLQTPDGGSIVFRRHHPNGPTEVIDPGSVGQPDDMLDVFDCPVCAMVAALNYIADLAGKRGKSL